MGGALIPPSSFPILSLPVLFHSIRLSSMLVGPRALIFPGLLPSLPSSLLFTAPLILSTHRPIDDQHIVHLRSPRSIPFHHRCRPSTRSSIWCAPGPAFRPSISAGARCLCCALSSSWSVAAIPRRVGRDRQSAKASSERTCRASTLSELAVHALRSPARRPWSIRD